jgi:hypothetical protein
MAKILNNLQVTVKNIHVRYEDNMSVPGVRVVAAAIDPMLIRQFSTPSQPA